MTSELTDGNLQTLNRIYHSLSSGSPPQQIFSNIFNALRQETAFSGLFISVSLPEARKSMPPFLQIQDTLIGPDSALSGLIHQCSSPAAEKEEMLLLSGKDLPPFPENVHGIAAPAHLTACPLSESGRSIGVMALLSDHQPDKGLQGLLENIASVLSLYLAKTALLNEKEDLQDYLFNIINSMPSVLIVVDAGARVIQWNFQAELETGMHESEAKGRPVEKVFPRIARYMALIRESIRFNRIKTRLRQEYTEGEETRFEDVIIYPLLTLKNQGVVIRMDDITEQVRMEEMMVQSEKMLSIGGLAAGMAHEINNPLAGMMQNAQVIYNRLHNEIPANTDVAAEIGVDLSLIREYARRRQILDKLDVINETGTRAAEIIRNMLGFARKSNTVFEPNDLPDIIRRTLKLIRHDYNLACQYDFKQIRITQAFEADMEPVLCDKNKIQQVLFNLLKNGAEAMFSNPDKKAPPEFIIRLYREDQNACIRIENNGPPISMEEQKRLFEPFFTTKPVGKGTGLGLSLSYFIIVKDHRGEMGVSTTSSGNTSFLIKLPY